MLGYRKEIDSKNTCDINQLTLKVNVRINKAACTLYRNDKKPPIIERKQAYRKSKTQKITELTQFIFGLPTKFRMNFMVFALFNRYLKFIPVFSAFN